VAGYLRLCGLDLPPHVTKAARIYRYHRRIFVAPPWKEIFTQDQERKQTFAEAQATCAAVCEVYEALGYQLIQLPRTSVAERADFVAAEIG
jgi:predicted ATPase